MSLLTYTPKVSVKYRGVEIDKPSKILSLDGKWLFIYTLDNIIEVEVSEKDEGFYNVTLLNIPKGEPITVTVENQEVFVNIDHSEILKTKKVASTSFRKKILKVIGMVESEYKPVNIKIKGKTVILICTPNLLSEPFQTCYHQIKKTVKSEHKIIVVETHYNEKPYNHSRDMNIALKANPEADYYVVMNDDIFTCEGWLEALIKPTLKDSSIGIVGGLYLYPDGETIQHAGAEYKPELPPKGYGVIHRFQGKKLKETPEALKPAYVWHITGALMLITRKCLEAIGPFDENLKLNWNDPDICLRAWVKGFKVYYTPECRAIHLEGKTLKMLDAYPYTWTYSEKYVKEKWKPEKLQEIQDYVNKLNMEEEIWLKYV